MPDLADHIRSRRPSTARRITRTQGAIAMSHTFSYDLTLQDSPTDAQARVRETVISQLRDTAGLHLVDEASHSLAFGPQWSWPVLVALSHKMNGENVKLSFGVAGDGTDVTVSGKVAQNAKSVADRAFWANALTGV
jgi:hypothetical protein